MIGLKIVTAALLLPALAWAIPSDAVQNSADIRALRESPYFKDGKIDLPVAQVCQGQLLMKGLNVEEGCLKAAQIASQLNDAESKFFCSHGSVNAKYDPANGLCQVILGDATQLIEDVVWPGKKCNETTLCYAPFEAHWNPFIGACTCAIDVYPELKSRFLQFEPNARKEMLYGPTKDDVNESDLTQAIDLLKGILRNVNTLRALRRLAIMNVVESYVENMKLRYLPRKKDLSTSKSMSPQKRSASLPQPADPDAVSLAPLPTYIPPPNTQVTQQLIQESLLIQPQQVAVVGSVIPDFANGVITFLVQLDGPISQTLALNATDSLPCDMIGTQPPPYLTLVPKTVKKGASETTLSTCLVIAVNMYEPQYITYWVQKEDGSVFSLLSDNKIHAVDQLDTSQPASIAIRVSSGDKNTKRSVDAEYSIVERHQIFSISCEDACPFYHMARLTSNDSYCGCMFEGADQHMDMTARAVEQPTQYTATMTAEACAAMACINNGGKPALFNPFTASCWCASPAFVETNENAYDGGV